MKNHMKLVSRKKPKDEKCRDGQVREADEKTNKPSQIRDNEKEPLLVLAVRRARNQRSICRLPFEPPNSTEPLVPHAGET